MRRVLPLEGHHFGELTAIERAPDYIDRNGRKRISWKCVCECGNKINVLQENLISGNSQSCGRCHFQNRWEIHDDYAVGYTLKNETFIIDRDDFELVSGFYWRPRSEGYFYTISNKKLILLHRLIASADDSLLVDHINHDLSDNRKNNLRCVTRSQNGCNKKTRDDSSTGVPGVWFRKDNRKWRAVITINQKRYNLGTYDNMDDAVAARKAAEEKYFGEYSYDNSIAAVPRIGAYTGDSEKAAG